MKILVTGASGFVGGSYLSRMRERDGLVFHGIGRRRLDDPSYSSIDLSHPFELDFDADVVVHAAARASPWGTREDYRRQNVDATRHVIDWCRRRPRLPRLVYVSSSSVYYRDGDQLGLTEDSPIGPAFVNEYAASKHAGERLVHDYPGEWTIVRPRAVFGPGDTVLFPRILAAAQRGRLPLIDSGGPPAIGDLIYIDTLSDYLHAAATSPHAVGRAFNLTNGQPVEILPFLLDVFDRLGIPRPIAARLAAHGDARRTRQRGRLPAAATVGRTARHALRCRRVRVVENVRRQPRGGGVRTSIRHAR